MKVVMLHHKCMMHGLVTSAKGKPHTPYLSLGHIPLLISSRTLQFRIWTRKFDKSWCCNMSTEANSDTTASPMLDSSKTESGSTDQRQTDVLVQYVVLRRDLIESWPLGSIVTQGCHASVAAIWSHKYDPDVTAYCCDANLDYMHKVTLEVKGEQQMKNLSEKLAAGGVDHKLWIEQPENIPTCLATKPYPKSKVSAYFKKLKLCK